MYAAFVTLKFTVRGSLDVTFSLLCVNVVHKSKCAYINNSYWFVA